MHRFTKRESDHIVVGGLEKFILGYLFANTVLTVALSESAFLWGFGILGSAIGFGAIVYRYVSYIHRHDH